MGGPPDDVSADNNNNNVPTTSSPEEVAKMEPDKAVVELKKLPDDPRRVQCLALMEPAKAAAVIVQLEHWRRTSLLRDMTPAARSACVDAMSAEDRGRMVREMTADYPGLAPLSPTEVIPADPNPNPNPNPDPDPNPNWRRFRPRWPTIGWTPRDTVPSS